MVLLLLAVSLLLGVLVNGLADNLPDMREEAKFGDLLPVCRYCGATRKISDASAFLSMFLRGGACARCRGPRVFRDLLVEGFLGISIPALWMAGIRSPMDLLTGSVILSACVLMAVIDLEHRSVISGVVIGFGVLLLILALLQGTSHFLWVLEGGAAGLVMMGFCYLLGWLLARLMNLGAGIEPLAGGDIWVGGIVGMMTGWPAIIPAIFLSIFLAGIFSIMIYLYHVIKRQPVKFITFAYAPYLLLAALIVHFAGSYVVAQLT